jgi:tetratricopeptide (TPR) repeat protein
MHDVLRTAFALHQSGQLAQAGQLYETILASDAANPEVLHLLGVLHHQQGDHARAVELIGRAVALQPNNPAFHANLAEAYRALGQFDRAAGCSRVALTLQPDYPEALGNLGLALQGMGRRDEALDQFRKALSLRPDFPVAHNSLGTVLRELGQIDEALAHFRRAVELDPAYALARTNLGQILLERGQPEQALPHCQEAVRLQPDFAPLHHNLGNVLRELKRLDEAAAAYLQAIRLDPALSKAHAHLGLTLLRQHRLLEAASCLERAVELDPTDPAFPEFLGELYMEREEFARAAASYERALAISTQDSAGLRLALGWALQEDGRINEAGQEYQTALRLQPGSAVVQNYLGGFHEERGELAEAEAAYRMALRLDPSFSLPLARLATLLRGKLPSVDLAALETRLAEPGLGPEPRGRLSFALAHVLDARGEYARAARCLAEANALTLESRRGRNDFVPAEHERFVDNVLRVFGPHFFARTAGLGSPSRRPVFIFGLPRSGTSLVEQVLASHSHVHGAGELRQGRQSFEAIPVVVGRNLHPMECIGLLDAASIRRLSDQHLDWLRARAGGEARRVTDKMPDNYMYVGLLATLFPHAAFIHCRRDLRDVAVSCWMTDFRSMPWPSSLEHIAARFQQYRRLMDHWNAVLPVPVHEANYEEMVHDLEGVARRLLAACGLEWEPGCLQFHATRRPVRTASLIQVRQPLSTASVGRWRNYETELAGLFAALPGN